eukprot:GHVU01022041.1.p1 GENE.GHVU01022041.1~~GHVU01022041.1.p1  ORF type:complete len:211 (+),score=40.10 GHVU01022041.1:758-1390(+)
MQRKEEASRQVRLQQPLLTPEIHAEEVIPPSRPVETTDVVQPPNVKAVIAAIEIEAESSQHPGVRKALRDLRESRARMVELEDIDKMIIDMASRSQEAREKTAKIIEEMHESNRYQQEKYDSMKRLFDEDRERRESWAAWKIETDKALQKENEARMSEVYENVARCVHAARLRMHAEVREHDEKARQEMMEELRKEEEELIKRAREQRHS